MKNLAMKPSWRLFWLSSLGADHHPFKLADGRCRDVVPQAADDQSRHDAGIGLGSAQADHHMLHHLFVAQFPRHIVQKRGETEFAIKAAVLPGIDCDLIGDPLKGAASLHGRAGQRESLEVFPEGILGTGRLDVPAADQRKEMFVVLRGQADSSQKPRSDVLQLSKSSK